MAWTSQLDGTRHGVTDADAAPAPDESTSIASHHGAHAAPHRQKLLHLEFIRAFAMLLVIFNHTGDAGYTLFMVRYGTALYPAYLFISIGCKIAVPLYWMVSGALLLPKHESIGYVYQHRVLRMVIALVLFSGVTYLWKVHAGLVSDPSAGDFLTILYSGKMANTYGFLVSYIAMMMVLPILRRFAQNMTAREFCYLFALAIFITGVVPLAEYLANQGTVQLNSRIEDVLPASYVVFFLAGYYFERCIPEEELSLRDVLAWTAVGTAAIVATGLVTHYKLSLEGITTGAEAEEFVNHLIALPTFAFYYTVRYLFCCYEAPRALRCVIEFFGGCAFGTMLLELILRTELSFISDALAPSIGQLPACAVWVLATYLACTASTALLKLMPGLKCLL